MKEIVIIIVRDCNALALLQLLSVHLKKLWVQYWCQWWIGHGSCVSVLSAMDVEQSDREVADQTVLAGMP